MSFYRQNFSSVMRVSEDILGPLIIFFCSNWYISNTFTYLEGFSTFKSDNKEKF